MHPYPMLEIDRGKLRHNIDEVTSRCAAKGISVAGVIKGMNGLPELIKVYCSSDVTMIGSSRIEQLQDVVRIGEEDPSLKKPTMMIRIPMLSEVPEIVKYCDYSLESEDVVLKALNEEVLRQAGAVDVASKDVADQVSKDGSACSADGAAGGAAGKHDVGGAADGVARAIHKHKVILMAEMGDLREGYVGDDLVKAALMVENELDGLELAGVGMNVGCYGSILPTREKLEEFVQRAEDVEDAIGRKLDIISGGATSSLMRVLDGEIPERINHLRIGEAILLARDLPLFYGCDLSFLNQDIFRLKMEVVELKNKPTYPSGTIGRDAFGHEPEYIDRGNRMHAICAGGKVDYGSEEEIFPLDDEIKIIGASSDHTLLDVEDYVHGAKGDTEEVDAGHGANNSSGHDRKDSAGHDLKVGDILTFEINYASMVFVTASCNIHIEYK